MKQLINDHLRVTHNVVQNMNASGACLLAGGVIMATGAGAVTTTVPAAISGFHDGLKIQYVSSTAQAHVLNFGSAICKNLTGAGANPCTTITFGAAIGTSVDVTFFQGIWTVTGTSSTLTYA